MARPDKAAAVAELTDSFRGASAAVLTEYRGLTVAQLKELRRSLAGNATYAVVKNTLTKIAAREAGIDAFESLLEGPSAIAFVTGDPVEVAKSLRAFGREHPLLVVKGGVLDGRAISADEVRKLADLESREVLLAKLAGGLNAPAQKLVSALAAPLAQFARLLGALEAKAQADPSVLAGGAGAAPAEAGPADPVTESAPAEAPADAAPEEPAAEPTPEPAASAATDTPQDAAPDTAEGDLPTDGTPGVEDAPDTAAAEQADDPGAEAQAVADATDPDPETDVADGATSTS